MTDLPSASDVDFAKLKTTIIAEFKTPHTDEMNRILKNLTGRGLEQVRQVEQTLLERCTATLEQRRSLPDACIRKANTAACIYSLLESEHNSAYMAENLLDAADRRTNLLIQKYSSPLGKRRPVKSAFDQVGQSGFSL